MATKVCIIRFFKRGNKVIFFNKKLDGEFNTPGVVCDNHASVMCLHMENCLLIVDKMNTIYL